jgi:hypothetical protein
MTAFKQRIPGYVALGLLTLSTGLWTFWGVGEMYYEGWWGSWKNRLPYLIPASVCYIFCFVAISWPRHGGWFLIIIGGAFTIWRWIRQAQLGSLTLSWAIGWLPISGWLVVAGVLFIMESRYRRQRLAIGWKPPARWLFRNISYAIAFTPSLLIFLGVTAHFTPLLVSRFDDNDRTARLIEGNGVVLIWAPEGPGWFRGLGIDQDARVRSHGVNLSWNDIALYGVPPVGFGDKPGSENRNAGEVDMRTTGLCRYLSEDGKTLMAMPQEIWRMPTTGEIVRSLVRKGESAGCSWDGKSTKAECAKQPNKDTPLWDPDSSAIYYLSGEEVNEGLAWYIPYTGGGLYGGAIASQWKWAGNSRHGIRCVREP